METKSDDNYWLVWSDDETFKNDNSTLYWKFDGSDLQGQLRTDSTYTVLVAGWRVPFLGLV